MYKEEVSYMIKHLTSSFHLEKPNCVQVFDEFSANNIQYKQNILTKCNE